MNSEVRRIRRTLGGILGWAALITLLMHTGAAQATQKLSPERALELRTQFLASLARQSAARGEPVNTFAGAIQASLATGGADGRSMGGTDACTDVVFYDSRPAGTQFWYYPNQIYASLDDGAMTPPLATVSGGLVKSLQFNFGIHADFNGDVVFPAILVNFWNAPPAPVSGASNPVVPIATPVQSFLFDFSPIGPLNGPADYLVDSGNIALAPPDQFLLNDTFYIEILPLELIGSTLAADPDVYPVFSVGPIVAGTNEDALWSDVFTRQGPGCGAVVPSNGNGQYEHPAELDDGGCTGFERQSPIRLSGMPNTRLTLEVSPGCKADGVGPEPRLLEVELWMRNLACPVTGFQAFLAYDPNVMTFVPEDPNIPYDPNHSRYNDPTPDPSLVTPSQPFSAHIVPMAFAEISAGGVGKLNLDGSVPLGYAGPGFSADAKLATLVFEVKAGVQCINADTQFRLVTNFNSEVSFQGSPYPTNLEDSPLFYLDNTPPVFTTTPANVNLQCLFDPIPAPDPNLVTAVDNCGGTVTVTWQGDVANSGVGCQADPKIVSRTYRATDPCGNFADHVQQFIFADTIAPTITTPAANDSVECDGTGVANQIAVWLASNGGAAASDNCLGPVTWTHDFAPGNFVTTCGNAGSVLVTFTATDSCGNTSNTQATFTITDTTAPAITTPAANAAVECDGTGVAAQIAAWLASNGGAAASDLCGGPVTWSNDFAPNNFVPSCGNAGSVAVVFTATDACGNSANTQATFTINDTTGPAITTPASNVSVECDGTGVAAQIAAWLASNGGAAASDLCGGPVTWVNDFAPGNFVAACGGTGSVLVNFQAKDACGNLSAVTSATFTIVDTTAPTISTPAANASVECDGSGVANQIAAWLASNGGAVAGDACSGPVTWTNDFAVGNFVATCGGAGSVLVTFTASDACGNSTATQATFTIADTTGPTISTPAANASVECDGTGVANQIAAWLATNGGAAASDGCSGPVVWSNDFAPSNFVSSCGNAGSVLVTFTATDACGNNSMTQATFSIADTTPPAITTPASNTSVECDGSGLVNQIAAFLASQGGAAASDLCGGPVTWVNDFDPNNVVPGCGNTGSVMVNFQAKDACGNLSALTAATFAIVDTTAPVVSCNNVSVPADAGGCTALVALVASANDACNPVNPASIVFTIDDDNNGFDPNDPQVVGAGTPFVFPQGTTGVRAEATDACNNSGDCTFTVAVANYNLASVEIELVGVFLPTSRCIRLVADDCDATLDVTLNFVDHDSNPLTPVRAVVPSPANPAKLQFPCGAWTGFCAKDRQHTVWDTDPLAVSGNEYVMPGLLSLRGGDTNDNGAVDINDVTFLIFQFGQLATPGTCPWNGAKDADFDNDGVVGSADYTFITANWLLATGCGCIDVPPRIGPPAEGVYSISTDTLPAELRAADLNRDGVVDVHDVEVFELIYGLSGELSERIRQGP